ncbi:MucBP domain-containing protein, partial [Enterococcus faecalis]|nr:MucBP domain-containing protein [Enterococcus faecalis]
MSKKIFKLFLSMILFLNASSINSLYSYAEENINTDNSVKVEGNEITSNTSDKSTVAYSEQDKNFEKSTIESTEENGSGIIPKNEYSKQIKDIRQNSEKEEEKSGSIFTIKNNDFGFYSVPQPQISPESFLFTSQFANFKEDYRITSIVVQTTEGCVLHETGYGYGDYVQVNSSTGKKDAKSIYQPHMAIYTFSNPSPVVGATNITGLIGATITSDYEVTININGISESTNRAVSFVTGPLKNFFGDPKQGTVKVKYVNETGQEIASEDTLTGNIGDQYQTQAKQVAGYVLKETPSNATGTYKEGTQTVTYVYKRQQGTVKVKYVDEVGQEIAPEDTLTGNIGDQYQTQAKQVAGYVLKETPSNATGTYKEGTQTVTYVYQPDFLIGVLPFKKDINQAVVGFRNNTDQPIPLYIKINNTKESLPTIQSIKILGLNDSDVEFVQTQTPLQSTITPIKNGKVFEVMPGRVELVYINYDKKTLNKLPRENYTTKFSWGTKNGDELTFKEEENYFGYPPKQGTVKVKYVNETGQEIASEDTLIGNVGDQYQTQAKQVAGYVLKETPSNATGTYKEGTQTVTYVYKRQQGTVKVKYVDEVGQEIAPEDTLTGNVGDQYQTQVKQVAGYVLKETPSNATGTYK